ncbi:hypothetical protein [Nocardioides acrostichi]|uniref:DUF222 domain-containing protein n=1 Tax=Nocardioides acrostichi TaxID=2784339 RepID=A0A930UXT7_9ACTN|nr:hypothetical protein [Nocardioides acrostichi]MBF4161652.1 hypothetical protein [Nocardioides acrostichi]
MNSDALADLSEDELLDLAGERAEEARRAETDLLHLAYQWAVINHPNRRREKQIPGAERDRAYGGAGSPEVAEFAAASLGARIRRTTWAARALMADALDLQHRLPNLWSRVQTGEVRASYARHVATRTRDLEPDQAGYVDDRVAESADGRIPWTRFETLVAGAIVSAAPALAAEKQERARRARFARRVGTPELGMASFMVRADAATIEQIDAAVTAATETVTAADPDLPADEAAVQAVLRLVTGTALGAASPAAKVDLWVHLPHDPRPTAADPESGAMTRQPRTVRAGGRATGEQPVTEGWVRDVLGPHASFTIRPVFYPREQAAVDAYEIPERHRRAVQILSPADCFPYGSATTTTAPTMQLDHTEAYDHGPPGRAAPPGQTRVENLGHLTTTHHRIKTHGGWHVVQPVPGIYLWTDPHDHHYLVDHTGTRPLHTPRPRPRPLVVEIYRPMPRITLAS